MIRRFVRNAVGMRTDELLCALGLERQRRMTDHLMTASTYFLAGALVGGSIALLVAPSSGRALRSQINERLREAGDRARQVTAGTHERAARPNPSPFEESAQGSAS